MARLAKKKGWFTAKDVLDWAKQRAGDRERMGGALYLMREDPDMLKLIAAWRQVPLPYLDMQRECNVPERLRIRWLWSLLDPDPTGEWIEHAGLPDAPHTRRACRMAADNLLVFPDGDIARSASLYFAPAAEDKQEEESSDKKVLFGDQFQL